MGLSRQEYWSGVPSPSLTIVIIWLIKIFLISSSVYSCYLFLISSPSVRSFLFLSFIIPKLAWNIPLVFPVFLKRSPVFLLLCIVHLRRLIISLCYSLELCIQLVIFFHFSLAFLLSSFLSDLQSLFRQPLCFLTFLFLWKDFDHSFLKIKWEINWIFNMLNIFNIF